MYKSILIVLVLFSVSSAFACLPIIGCWDKFSKNIKETKSVCATVKTSVEWKYCYTPSSLSDDTRVIYYFHGGGGDEKGWLNSSWYPEVIRKHWKENKIATPNVITVSFGDLWVLASRSEKPKSGLYEVFLNEVLPYMEQKVLKKPVKERIAVGESMGGFNAGTFTLRNPQLFSKIALLCPAVAIANEKTSRDVEGYIKDTGASRSQAEFIVKVRNEYFPTWEAAHAASPLTLMENLNLKPGQSKKVFISCGDKDEFGFFSGSQMFVEAAAKTKGVDVTWTPSTGEHCSMELESLIEFLDK